MKILILGASGQVGWELQRSLAPLGEIVALDATTSAPLTADFRKLLHLTATVRLVSPDVVVNAAAMTDVDRCESEAELANMVNAIAPAALARESADLGAWMVHYSSDHVFNGSGTSAWTEASPCAPLNVYGRTKLAGEQAIRQSGCRHLILRTSWVHSARRTNFVLKMLRLAREHDRLQVVDDQFGAPTGARLLAEVTANALRRAIDERQLGGTYHAAASGVTSRYGCARHVVELARSLGLPLKLRPEDIEAVGTETFPTAARRPCNSRLDTQRLRSAFRLDLPDWRIGVARTLREAIAGRP